MAYRLHIDIPLHPSMTEEQALITAQKILEFAFAGGVAEDFFIDNEVEQINYRLGHDDDRQKSNYFIKDERGHVNNKKSKIVFTPTDTDHDPNILSTSHLTT